MKRVLVTGASGLVGRNVLQPLLARGFEVIAVARGEPQDPPVDRRVAWRQADLLDDSSRGELIAEVAPSHLLHLAWYAEPGLYWEASENLDWMRATVMLTSEFASAGGKRAVYAGTCAEYLWNSRPLEESSPLAPTTLYGIAKNATRQAVSDLAPTLGISIAWGRIFFVYGPGEDRRRLVASVARSLIAKERVATTKGDQVRDFMFVGDVGDAFAALTDSQVEGAVNVATGRGVAVSSVTSLIGEMSGRPDLIDAGALEQSQGDPDSIVADTTILTEEVGWTPSTALEEGIAATVEWWRTEQSTSIQVH